MYSVNEKQVFVEVKRLLFGLPGAALAFIRIPTFRACVSQCGFKCVQIRHDGLGQGLATASNGKSKAMRESGWRSA